MPDSGDREPRVWSSREILADMFSDALGYKISSDTLLTSDEELVAGAIVQSRLDAVAEEMDKMRRGEQVDIDKLMDTKAQAALLEMQIESRPGK